MIAEIQQSIQKTLVDAQTVCDFDVEQIKRKAVRTISGLQMLLQDVTQANNKYRYLIQHVVLLWW